MWTTNVALEIGKLLNKQNKRKRRQKILLVFASTIPFMTHDPILFYSFLFIIFQFVENVFHKVSTHLWLIKNLMLLMCFTWKIETFHSIYMRIVYILVFLYLHRFWYSHSFPFHPRTDKLKKHILKSTMTLFKVSTHRKFNIIFLAQKSNDELSISLIECI